MLGEVNTMLSTRRFIPLVGIGLAVWGLITFDWFRLGIGVVIFLGSFAWDSYKVRAVLQSGTLFSVYKPLNELIRLTRKAIETRNNEMEQPKTRLACALLFMGMIDAASQGAGLEDKQFLDIFTAIFHNLDYAEPLRSRVLLFHQSVQLKRPGYAAILKGGEMYTKFYNGNRMIIMTAGALIEEFVKDPDFPATEVVL